MFSQERRNDTTVCREIDIQPTRRILQIFLSFRDRTNNRTFIVVDKAAHDKHRSIFAFHRDFLKMPVKGLKLPWNFYRFQTFGSAIRNIFLVKSGPKECYSARLPTLSSYFLPRSILNLMHCSENWLCHYNNAVCSYESKFTIIGAAMQHCCNEYCCIAANLFSLLFSHTGPLSRSMFGNEISQDVRAMSAILANNRVMCFVLTERTFSLSIYLFTPKHGCNVINLVWLYRHNYIFSFDSPTKICYPSIRNWQIKYIAYYYIIEIYKYYIDGSFRTNTRYCS